MYHAHQIDFNGAMPRFDRTTDKRTEVSDTCVVDEDVDRADLFVDTIGEGLHAGLLRNIGHLSKTVNAQYFYGNSRLVQTSFVNIGDDEIRAPPRKS